MKLKDLIPGTEFEYIDQGHSYRRGKFLVLNICFVPANRMYSVAILSYVTKKVCNHWGQLKVSVISKPEKTMENTMSHFIGWKFGVPVRVCALKQENQKAVSGVTKLIYEDNDYFNVTTSNGMCVLCNKSCYYYELIPHNYSRGIYSPRYPICSNNKGTAFCNAANNFNDLGTALGELIPCPAATLNIDGKTIELSAETIAELKKKLGI